MVNYIIDILYIFVLSNIMCIYWQYRQRYQSLKYVHINHLCIQVHLLRAVNFLISCVFFQGFRKAAKSTHKILGGGFKYVLCSSQFGERIPFDEHMFQMGWFNHQLEWCAPNGICFPSSCVQREAYRQSINRNIYVNMSPLNRGFPHLRQVGECKGKPFKSLIGFDELFFYPPKGSMWRGCIFTYSKNHWTLRIWGVWMCMAGVWDLQTTSFEIPWFLGYMKCPSKINEIHGSTVNKHPIVPNGIRHGPR